MKFAFLAIFIFFFVALPLYVLNVMVMPELQSLQHVYQHADVIAERATGVPAQ